jgi:hypothetical protein
VEILRLFAGNIFTIFIIEEYSKETPERTCRSLLCIVGDVAVIEITRKGRRREERKERRKK